MSFELNKSTQFKIKELVIVTKFGQIDISGICDEINIFDSLFLPVISGNLLIRDSLGLSSKLLFDGSESILIEIVKNENSEIANFKKAFRIYKQSERTSDRPGSEFYLLHFVSDELFFSDQQKINQSYQETYSNIVSKILIDYLRVSQNNLGGLYENSLGVKKVIIPNLRPLEAIEWCAKRAIDKNNSPNFLFFQNVTGYNFVTLSTLLNQKEILDIKYQTKNIEGNNPISEMHGARSIEAISQNDIIKKTRSGVNAGKFIGFDPITKTISTKNISYADQYGNMKHGNETPNFTLIKNRDGTDIQTTFDSKKTVSFFSYARQFSNYIKEKDPSSLSKEENIENWLFQRQAIMNNLVSKRLKVVMPGNFQLSSGFNVNVEVPSMGIKDKNSDNEDKSLNGKYIIIASRHIIGFEKHETIVEVASSSTSNEFIPASSSEQTNEILEY
jgi:hypothetical protein